MKGGLLAAAAALVLGANLVIAVNGARNRLGAVEASVILTSCELRIDARSPDNSFTSARFSFIQPQQGGLKQVAPRDLGFSARGREPARDAYVALTLSESPTNIMHTRLEMLDAASDPAALRARHPDRSRVLILPAVIHAYEGRVVTVELSRPEVHVPYPLARKLDGASCSGPGRGTHRITVKTGQRYEAWIADVADR